MRNMLRIWCGKSKRDATIPRHTIEILGESRRRYIHVQWQELSNYSGILQQLLRDRPAAVEENIWHRIFLKKQFARHGIPSVVFSDNSPFNSQEFRKFAELYEFEHQTSSPRYPQSNGKTENAVWMAKHLMTKAVESARDPFLPLLDWRNTPSEQLGQLLVQILFGRHIRTRMPTANKLLQTEATKTVKDALAAAKAR